MAVLSLSCSAHPSNPLKEFLLPTQIELLEILQGLHQQQESLDLHWLEPGPGGMARHVSNLPRLRMVEGVDQAMIVAGSFEQLLDLKPSNRTLLLTDPKQPHGSRLIELLIKGYRLQAKRLLLPVLKPLLSEQQLRILVLTNLYPPQELGGYGRSIFDFVSNLRLLGHTVVVISSDAPYLGGDLTLDHQVNRGLQLLGSYENGLTPVTDQVKRQLLQASNVALLDRLQQQFRPQAVLLGNLDMLGPELLHHLIARGLPCWHHHGFSQLAFASDQLPVVGLPYFPLANSHFSARSLQQQLRDREPGPLPVIYPGAQTHLFADLEPQALGGPLRISFAGLLIGAKGAHVLLEALAQLKQWGLPFSCDFAGGRLGDDYPENLKGYVAQVGIGEQVRFLGRLDRHELRELFASCPVFVFPSTWDEPFGISQVEALSAGCLVVSSGTGGAGETVHDDVNGRRFRPSDSAHLAEVLADIYRNPQAHEPLRHRGRRLAQTHFDTARETQKLSQLMLAEVSRLSGVVKF